MRTFKKIVIHCTDSDDSLDIGRKEIDEWHRQRGWMSESGISIGYHYVVRRSGQIEIGRPVQEVGSHVKGHNSDSIGVVWVGRKSIDKKQKEMLFLLVKQLMNTYNIPIDKVLGHYELDPHKTCPNLDMHFVRADLLFVKTTV